MVDPVIPNLELRSFDVATDTLVDFPFSYKSLQTNDQGSEASFLEKDRARGLLRVWYLLFDGLTSAIPNCPREHQSLAVDTLFEMLQGLQQGQEEGEEEERILLLFGLYCANHLLMPTLQAWLRRSQRTFQGWHAAAASFKHCTGRTTELVMGWLRKEKEEAEKGRTRLNAGAALALKQLLLILTECTTVPVEAIARLGCSCFRYRELQYYTAI